MRLQLLACGPEKNLVHIHLFRLADRKRHHAGECVGGNHKLGIELLQVRGDVRLDHTVRQLRGDGAGRDNGGADAIGLDFHAQPF